jgi:hypothetical protein
VRQAYEILPPQGSHDVNETTREITSIENFDCNTTMTDFDYYITFHLVGLVTLKYKGEIYYVNANNTPHSNKLPADAEAVHKKKKYCIKKTTLQVGPWFALGCLITFGAAKDDQSNGIICGLLTILYTVVHGFDRYSKNFACEKLGAKLFKSSIERKKRMMDSYVKRNIEGLNVYETTDGHGKNETAKVSEFRYEDKNLLLATTLLLGWLGVHRMIVGHKRWWTIPVLCIFTVGLVIPVVDFVYIIKNRPLIPLGKGDKPTRK